MTLVWCVEAKWPPVNFGCLCRRTQRAGVRGVCIIAPKASVYILAVWSGACTFEVVVKAFVAVYTLLFEVRVWLYVWVWGAVGVV